VNYAIGKFFGAKVAARFINPVYLDKTHRFYGKHGGKTIILARFVPIVRTFAPFVAGMGAMEYRRFFLFNVTGALAWVLLFTYAGYFFGNIPAVEERFTLVVLGIIVVSLVPIMVEFLRARLQRPHPGGPEAVAAAVEAAEEVAEDEAERKA
jgi:membrane-associated protein